MNATAYAQSLVGVPYRRGGTSREEGFDCFTLLAHIRRECYARDTPHAGLPAPEIPSAQAAALAIYRATGGQEQVSTVWLPCKPRDGCAVAMGRRRLGRLHHCGVLVDRFVLHALESLGVAMMPLERCISVYPRTEFFECPI